MRLSGLMRRLLTVCVVSLAACGRPANPGGGPEMMVALAKLATAAAIATSNFASCPNDGKATHEASGATALAKCGLARAGVRAEVSGSLTFEERTVRCGGADRPATFITGSATLGGDVLGDLEPRGFSFCVIQDSPQAVNLVGFLRFGTGDFVTYNDTFYTVGSASW